MRLNIRRLQEAREKLLRVSEAMRDADGARLSAIGDLLFLYASTVNWFFALRTYKARLQTCVSTSATACC